MAEMHERLQQIENEIAEVPRRADGSPAQRIGAASLRRVDAREDPHRSGLGNKGEHDGQVFADEGGARGQAAKSEGCRMNPLAIDLFCGLGGWAHGLIAEGWYVVGFDIERHEYDGDKYPGQLVLQDVLTLHGSQFKDADLIVASPPCQAYSYRAMPWKKARELPPPSNELFDACFRIQREACEAAGRHIPLIVENVRGAQKWVGRSRWNFGSYHLWGDVPALMPVARASKNAHAGGGSWFAIGSPGQTKLNGNPRNPKSNDDDGIKQGGTWWHDTKGASCQFSSKSKQRKAWSAKIAKIPAPLAQHIAIVFKPSRYFPLAGK